VSDVVIWSCDSSGGVSCPQTGGSGDLDQTIASMPLGALLNFTFYGNVSGLPQQIRNPAQVRRHHDRRSGAGQQQRD